LADNALLSKRRYTPADDYDYQPGGGRGFYDEQTLDRMRDLSIHEKAIINGAYQQVGNFSFRERLDPDAVSPSQWQQQLAADQRSAGTQVPDVFGRSLPSIQSQFMRAYRERPDDQVLRQAIEVLSNATGIRPPWERVPRKFKGY
jgi:hypothetical protein